MKHLLTADHLHMVDVSREVGYPTHVHPYTAGVLGGMLGGLAMIVPAIGYGLLSGHGIWYPVNLVAAVVIREMQGMMPEQLASFNPLALIAGLTIHLSTAAVLGLLFAILLPTLPGRPVLWALVVGPLLWFGTTLLVLPQLNPVMSQWLDWPSFALANIVYGLVMGGWVMYTPRVESARAHHLHLHWPVLWKR